MQSCNSDLLAFQAALADLEAHLAAQRWVQAGGAGEALAQASERCSARNLVLPAPDLERAKELYERCLQLTLNWGDALNQEAQTAGSSQRAFQTYTQG